MESAGGGVAPFASVEDLSDEPEQEVAAGARLTLPGADGAAGARSPRMGVPTPRIDISRASSSSHQDDSSPERDLFTGGEGAPVAKLGLGFTEEMAQELRNSTEELDFQDPTELETKQRRRKLHQQQAVLDMQGQEGKERKDSACSDTGLLYISGRTSRLSSIGSAASGGSAASHASGVSGVSGISAASHLSATSQLSRASRCSSPHKMLLETSFCGPKPIPTVSLDAEYPPKESVEATLLARQTDPTGAVLPQEHMVNGRTGSRRENKSKGSSSTLSVTRDPSIKSKSSERSERSKSQGRDSRSSSFHSKTSRTSETKEEVVPAKTEEEKTTPVHRKEPPRLPPGSDAKFISLHGDEEQPVISVSRSKSKTLPLEPDQRIISLHDDEPVKQSEQKRTLPLDNDSTFISLHSDPPPLPPKTPTQPPKSPTPPPKTLVVSTSKRKTPSKEGAKTLPARKIEPKSLAANTSKRKEPIKYEGDQIFIPLTGDETPIVLSGGKKPPTTTTVLEGDSIIIPLHGTPEEEVEKPSKTISNTPLDKDSRIIPLKGDEIEIHTTTRKMKDNDQPPPKAMPPRRKPTIPPDASAVIIPLHGDEEIVALEIETDRPSSPEYGIYIPLKGPLPEGADFTKKSPMESRPKPKQDTDTKPKKLEVKTKGKGRTPKTSPTVIDRPIRKKEDEELVKFISLHADESERQPIKIEVQEDFLDEKYNLKPEDLRPKSVSPSPGSHSDIQSIQHAYFRPDDSSAYSRKHSTSSCRSPEFEGAKVKPATLDLTSIMRPSRPVQSLTQLTRDESRTPSPATSMSRGSLFRRSSESSSSTKSRASGKKKKEKYNTIAGNRSQNISSEFRSRKDSKNKTIFSSLFKRGSRDSVRRKSESSEKTTPLDPRLTKVEFTFNQQNRRDEPDSIIIPRHSPPPEVAQSISEVVLQGRRDEPDSIIIPLHTPSEIPPPEVAQSISEVVLQGRRDEPDSIIIPLHSPPEVAQSISEVVLQGRRDEPDSIIIPPPHTPSEIPPPEVTQSISEVVLQGRRDEPDSIIIPLHSPPEVAQSVSEVVLQGRRDEPDSIIIPLHSPPEVAQSISEVVLQGRRDEPDSIIIPLHSPSEIPPPEVAQSISEVVAAIEELKSQPLESPVPTPSSSSARKKPADPVPPKKTEPKVEPVDKPEENELKLVIVTETEILKQKTPEPHAKRESDQKLDFKIKQEIEKLQEAKSEKDRSASVVVTKNEDANTKELEVTPRTSLEADISPRSETSGGSAKTQLEAPSEKQESDRKSDTETIKTGSEERRSSESEPDSDAVPIPPVAEDEHERKGLFNAQESVDDELPYVPTTLPQERPVAHPIIPVKQRVPEAVKTCPIDRPRSTTPIDPSKLDDYVSSPHDDPANRLPSREKMQIVLPRKESVRESRSKSPHKPGAKPWTHFAEQGLQSPRELRRVSSPSPPPPPLPPRAWVCFDEVPERRRTPKRITTLPPTQPATSSIVYSYVNPEECSCECHESQGRVNGAQCGDGGAHCYKDPYRT